MKKTLLIIIIVSLAIQLTAQWSENPSVNNVIYSNNGNETFSSLQATDANTEMTYIQWFTLESTGMQPRLQLVNNQGIMQWGNNGIVISTHPNSTALYGTALEMSSDGCALIGFSDQRNTTMNPYIYKISQTGEFVWGHDGIRLSTLEAFRIYIKPCNDGSAWAAWVGEKCYMRHINADGSLDPIITVLQTNEQTSFGHIIVDDNNNVTMAYLLKTGGSFMMPTQQIKICKYSTDGTQIWSTHNILMQNYTMNFTSEIQLEPDGLGGGYVTTTVISNSYHQALMCHFNADGIPTTSTAGVFPSNESTYYNYYPVISVDPTTHNCIMFFRKSDHDENYYYELKGQCFTINGEKLWGDSGKSLSGSTNYVYPITCASVPEGGAVLIYDNDDYQPALKAMRVDINGNFVWGNGSVDICNVTSTKSPSDVTTGFHNGQLIYSWHDGRTPTGLYAQNLKLDGTLGPIAGAVTGDANGDGSVNVNDIMCTIAYIFNNNPQQFVFANADVNDDGIIDVRDIMLIVDIINQ